MSLIPEFTADGLLPPGEYEVTFQELRQSVRVVDAAGSEACPSWDRAWRAKLADNLEILVGQLWHVGITDIFIDGSFTEDEDHPNDIDGYFVCDLMDLAHGKCQRELSLLDPHKIWT